MEVPAGVLCCGAGVSDPRGGAAASVHSPDYPEEEGGGETGGAEEVPENSIPA